MVGIIPERQAPGNKPLINKGYLIAGTKDSCYSQAADTGWFPDGASKQAHRREIPLTAE